MNLSYREASEWLKTPGRHYAFLPVGCYEQHGPELPLATDILQAEELARRLAARYRQENSGWALVLPSIAYTPTDPNKGYPGTVTVTGDAFRAYFESVLRGIFHSEFDAIVVVNSHGSVDALIKETNFKLVFEQFDQGTRPVRPILCLNVYDAAGKAAELFAQSVGRHADWTEFLMTYSLLGPDYYDQSRLERLRAFARSHDFQVRMPSVLGIPARYRSVDGVQGEPFPSAAGTLDELADQYWQVVEAESFLKLQRELNEFFERFDPSARSQSQKDPLS